jgi:hypothetical protein
MIDVDGGEISVIGTLVRRRIRQLCVVDRDALGGIAPWLAPSIPGAAGAAVTHGAGMSRPCVPRGV